MLSSVRSGAELNGICGLYVHSTFNMRNACADRIMKRNIRASVVWSSQRKHPKDFVDVYFPSRVTFEPGICNPMDIYLCEHERDQNKGVAQEKNLCS